MEFSHAAGPRRSLLFLIGIAGGLMFSVLYPHPGAGLSLKTDTSAEKDPVPARKPGPAVQVLTVCSGLTASSMEKAITNRVERWISQADGVRRIESHTIAGASIVRAYFHEDVAPALALVQVSALAQATLPTLPPGTLPPLVLPLDPRNTRHAALLAVENPALSEGELLDVARIDVRRALAAIEGCAAPVVLGGKERIIAVVLDRRKLQAYNLSPLDVVQALRKAKQTPMPGAPSTGDGQTRIVISAGTDRIADLNDVPIRLKPGESIFLRDIGQVEDGYAVQTSLVRVNGRRGVIVPIGCRAGAESGALRQRLTQALPRQEARLPRGTRLALLPLSVERKGDRRSDAGPITLHLRAPSDLRLAATEKRIVEVERFLERNIPAVERRAIISEVGVSSDLSAAYSHNAGEQDATLHVLLSADGTRSAAEHVARLRRLFHKEVKFADLRVRIDTGSAVPPIIVRITGSKPDEQAKLARTLRDRLAQIRGAADVDVAQRLDAPEVLIEVDRQKAAQAGLSGQEVVTQVAAALRSIGPLGSPSWIDPGTGVPYSVGVRYSEDSRLKLEDALEIPAVTGQRAAIKLSSLVTLRKVTTAVEIDHVNLRRVFDVRINTEGRERAEVLAEVEKVLKEVQTPDGIRAEVEESQGEGRGG